MIFWSELKYKRERGLSGRLLKGLLIVQKAAFYYKLNYFDATYSNMDLYYYMKPNSLYSEVLEEQELKGTDPSCKGCPNKLIVQVSTPCGKQKKNFTKPSTIFMFQGGCIVPAAIRNIFYITVCW